MRAKILNDIIYNFDKQRPLSPDNKEEWESFYIDTRRPEIEKIKTEFLGSPPGHKVLFGGHAGNGKSTELNKLVNDKDIKKRFEIIKFDIQNSLNPYDIEIVELLLNTYFEILGFAALNKLSLASYLEDEFKKMEGFFRDTLKMETIRLDRRTGELGLGAEAEAGIKIPFLKLKSVFSAKIQSQREVREDIRKEYRPRLYELTDLLKKLLMDLKTKLKEKEPLIVIDGLDRIPVEAAEKLFVDDGQNIAQVDNVSMLLTVPISTIHSVQSARVTSSLGQIRTLKNIRLKTREKKDDDITRRNWDMMREVVWKRVTEDLIDREALDKAIYYSGGVFRILFELITDAAVHSKTFDGKTISTGDMEEAVREKQINKSRTLSRSLWEILLEVDGNNKFLHEMDTNKLNLLAGMYALEYINGEEWYAVNPLLEDKLEDYRKLRKSEEKKNAAKKR